MNCTSHEIALRLQQAGFPTPEPMPGQFWYDPNDLPEAGRTWADHKRSGRVYLRTEKYFATVNPDCIYAPTIAEILQELPGFSLKAADNGHGFYCYRLDPNTARWSLNAADACARAWLSLHEKKETP